MSWLAGVGVALTPYAWAGHAALALVMQIVVSLILNLAAVRNAWWLGAALSIGFWWSREKTEFEFHLKSLAHAASLGPYWYRGFLPLEWDTASQMQFYAPAALNLLVALLLNTRPDGRSLLHRLWARRGVPSP
jgi:hypothetical protein